MQKRSLSVCRARFGCVCGIAIKPVCSSYRLDHHRLDGKGIPSGLCAKYICTCNNKRIVFMLARLRSILISYFMNNTSVPLAASCVWQQAVCSHISRNNETKHPRNATLARTAGGGSSCLLRRVCEIQFWEVVYTVVLFGKRESCTSIYTYV